jgi:hypothetical protein
LRYGTFSPRELLELAVENGVKEFVLTDINSYLSLFGFHPAIRTLWHPPYYWN